MYSKRIGRGKNSSKLSNDIELTVEGESTGWVNLFDEDKYWTGKNSVVVNNPDPCAWVVDERVGVGVVGGGLVEVRAEVACGRVGSQSVILDLSWGSTGKGKREVDKSVRNSVSLERINNLQGSSSPSVTTYINMEEGELYYPMVRGIPVSNRSDLLRVQNVLISFRKV